MDSTPKCSRCGWNVLQAIGSGAGESRCQNCGFQSQSGQKKKLSESGPPPTYVQPGYAQFPNTFDPGKANPPCPADGLTSVHVGSSQYPFVCPNGHQFTLSNALGQVEFISSVGCRAAGVTVEPGAFFTTPSQSPPGP
jgi:hypothetical protein